MKSLQTQSPTLPVFSAAGRKLHALPVAARLRIDYGTESTGFAFEPQGEFPRRVVQGEVLALADGFPLLAPRSGPVELDEENRRFDLRVEGALKIGHSGNRETLRRLEQAPAQETFRRFVKEVREAGIPSLDFDGIPLYRLFEIAANADDLTVILSTRDPESAIVWEKLLGRGFAEVATLLEKLLAGRGSVPLRRYGGQGAFALEELERYGRFLPHVIARQVFGGKRTVANDRGLAEQGIVFVGPATLYAVQNLLLDDRPYYSRPVAMRVDARGLAGLRPSRVHELPNGYPLPELFRSARLSEAVGIIAGDLVRNRERVYSQAELPNLNLFRHSSFYASRRHRFRYDLNLPCTGCMACQRICPVDAGPLALVEGRNELFRGDECLDCGLCTFVCDSAIPIDGAIAGQRAGGDPTA